MLSRGKKPKKVLKSGGKGHLKLFSCLYKIHPGGEELLLAYEPRWSRTERPEGMCFSCCFFLLTLQRCIFFSSVWQSLPQGTRILKAQLGCGLAGWIDPLQTCESGRCWFQDQDYLECNEKKSAIASNQRIQLSFKKHYGIFFFFLSQSVIYLRDS